LVAPEAGVEGYVAAIRDALARPGEARARAERMRERIRVRHSLEVFSESVRRLMSFRAGDAA